ncbi:MAG: hypothetical protein HQL19_06690 [Candidatus Omnitrophica bacterium]|nr:hypothetical protein [Candidatus Omnitrophota bacterium]
MSVWILIGVLLTTTCVKAEETPGPAVAVIAEATIDPALVHMRQYVEIERQKEEQIQLLQLDLEQLKLEAEKKKVMGEMGVHVNSGPASDKEPHRILKYVLVTDQKREALIEEGGQERRVSEGDRLGEMQVSRIDASGVLLKAPDNHAVALAVNP